MGFSPDDTDPPVIRSSRELIRGSQKALVDSESLIRRSDWCLNESSIILWKRDVRREISVEGSIRPLVPTFEQAE